MTVGKDVSALFPDVVNCMQTDNLELKKLVYLYLMNYAKSQPDMAIMAVNTFVKVGKLCDSFNYKFSFSIQQIIFLSTNCVFDQKKIIFHKCYEFEAFDILTIIFLDFFFILFDLQQSFSFLILHEDSDELFLSRLLIFPSKVVIKVTDLRQRF